MTDAPRTIWATAPNKGGHVFANAERFDDAPHRYHHDAVVREKDAQLAEMQAHVHDLQVALMDADGTFWLLGNEGWRQRNAAALAKIAQEGKP